MLHEVTVDGGLGFCHAALPDLLPFGYHGPLVVALDSNVLIDLQQYGNLLLNNDLPEVGKTYAKDLAGLSDLLNLWLLRDIRFVVTPRSRTDAKKVNQQFLDRRLPAIDALASSLAFQFGDWTGTAPSHADAPAAVGEETGLPASADRELVLEAQAVGSHAFLTRDRLVLDRVSLSGPAMTVGAPSALAAELVEAGVQPFFGGTCDAENCPYGGWSLPAPDTANGVVCCRSSRRGKGLSQTVGAARSSDGWWRHQSSVPLRPRPRPSLALPCLDATTALSSPPSPCTRLIMAWMARKVYELLLPLLPAGLVVGALLLVIWGALVVRRRSW